MAPSQLQPRDTAAPAGESGGSSQNGKTEMFEFTDGEMEWLLRNPKFLQPDGFAGQYAAAAEYNGMAQEYVAEMPHAQYDRHDQGAGWPRPPLPAGPYVQQPDAFAAQYAAAAYNGVGQAYGAEMRHDELLLPGGAYPQVATAGQDPAVAYNGAGGVYGAGMQQVWQGPAQQEHGAYLQCDAGEQDTTAAYNGADESFGTGMRQTWSTAQMGGPVGGPVMAAADGASLHSAPVAQDTAAASQRARGYFAAGMQQSWSTAQMGGPVGGPLMAAADGASLHSAPVVQDTAAAYQRARGDLAAGTQQRPLPTARMGGGGGAVVGTWRPNPDAGPSRQPAAGAYAAVAGDVVAGGEPSPSTSAAPAPTAAAAATQPRKANRMGNKPGHKAALNRHQQQCKEVPGCRANCPLWLFDPAAWTKQSQARVRGVVQLWRHLYCDRQVRGKK
ncbi:hypothetical protein LTR08_003893 [Meristemomyces frigidus]|nr:hypothetical protein LTR08_003893 [Meristemomyces frigidus]